MVLHVEQAPGVTAIRRHGVTAVQPRPTETARSDRNGARTQRSNRCKIKPLHGRIPPGT